MQMRQIIVAVTLAAFLSGTGIASGATIAEITGVSGGGLGSVVEVPGSTLVDTAPFAVPNNDNVDFSDNFFLYDVRFDAVAPIDVVFRAVNSGGTSEYDTVLNTLHNNTAVSWTGFKLEIGFGTGAAFQTIAGTGLDFDSPDMDSFVDPPTFLPSIDHQELSLTFSGGLRAPGLGSGPSFSIDVPDSTLVPDAAKTADGYLFTLRHTPIAPAPPNLPPQADDDSLAVFAGALIDFTFTGIDPEGTPLIWSLISFTGPTPLHAPTFNSLTQQFLWDTTGSAGTFFALVNASDGSLNDEATLSITVASTRQAIEVPEPLSVSALLLASAIGLMRRSRHTI
ncbi:MAG: hypothetical protein WD768_11875 [Phycisphaeraceae bacterium]